VSRSPGSARVLFEKARQLQEDRKNKTKKQEEAKRLQRLAEIERDQKELWRRVDALIAAKTTKAYDEAIGILKDLRDLALHRQQPEEFAQRINATREKHPRLVGLQWRIKEAKLL
jgi:leucyl aminopeptidase